MGLGYVWGISAGIMAIAAGGFIADGLSRSVRRKRAVMTLHSDRWVSRVRFFLICGIRPLQNISHVVLKLSSVDGFAEKAQVMLEEQGYTSKKEALVSLLLAWVIISFALALLLSGSLVFGMAVGCIGVIAVAGSIKRKSDTTTRLMREGVPEVIRCMQTCFKSGQSLLQTLRYVAAETEGALKRLFSVAADRLDMGDTPKAALSVLGRYPDVPELSFVAMALDIQHQTGGSIVSVLESARESVEGELELMRTLRVQTAQAKLSASIVTVMPFVLIALFSLMSPGFLAPFVDSWQGVCMLVFALIMQFSGVISVRRMLKIDIA